MRALVVSTPGNVELRERDAPAAGAGEILVQPVLAGMCGTDLELIDGTIDPAYVRYPLVLGHEWVGRLSRDEDGLGPAGTAVVVEGVIPCGHCDECTQGATNRCETYDEIGFTRDGALADAVVVPSSLAHPLGADVALDDAVLVEPMAVVWRALTRLPLREGLRVAVIGDGTIALLSAHLVRQFSPASVTIFGRRAEQKELARQAGADTFVTTTPSGSYDLVIEAAGVGPAVSAAIEIAARGAIVALLGLPPHGTTVALAPDDLVNNDVVIHGSFSYTRDAFAEVVARLNERALRPSFLITHRFAFDDALRAVAALRGGAGPSAPRGKVVVEIAR